MGPLSGVRPSRHSQAHGDLRPLRMVEAGGDRNRTRTAVLVHLRRGRAQGEVVVPVHEGDQNGRYLNGHIGGMAAGDPKHLRTLHLTIVHQDAQGNGSLYFGPGRFAAGQRNAAALRS